MKKVTPCPVCKKNVMLDETNSYRPFCSERCQLLDLGEWLQESYTFSESVHPKSDNL